MFDISPAKLVTTSLPAFQLPEFCDSFLVLFPSYSGVGDFKMLVFSFYLYLGIQSHFSLPIHKYLVFRVGRSCIHESLLSLKSFSEKRK